MSKLIYILDPGHGGVNPSTGLYVTAGKRSPKWPDGSIYYEGVGNRDIARRASIKLTALGISHAYTVNPSDWTDVGLTKRCRIADRLILNSGKPGLTLSIHSNGVKSQAAHGYEVFTSPGQTPSDPMADLMFLAIKAAFPELTKRTDLRDGDYDKEAKFTILTGTKCPSVLIESMFHSNPKECKILMSPEGRQRIANALVAGILEIEKRS